MNGKALCEKYMSDGTGELADYKIHSFNGEPKIILVCKNRFSAGGLTEDFYDTNWKQLNISREKNPNSKTLIKKPNELDKMLEFSQKLSENLPFVRTDFYCIKGNIYFGEITFFPASGFESFVPPEWDVTLGSWLELPQ